VVGQLVLGPGATTLPDSLLCAPPKKIAQPHLLEKHNIMSDSASSTLIKSRPQRLSLRSNVSWALAGNIVNAGSHWAMLAVLAKLGTAETVGQFSLGLALGAPVMMLSRLQLRHIQATDAHGERSFEDYFFLRALGTLVALCITIALAFFSGYSITVRSVAIALGLQKAFESMSDIHYGSMQRSERMDLVARSLSAKGIAGLAALGISFVITDSVVWAAATLSGVYLLMWLLYDWRRASPSTGWLKHDLKERLARALSLARFALPLGIVTMLLTLDRNIPRYVIGYSMDERSVGLYSALAYLPVIGSTVVTAVGQSVSPRMAQIWTGQNKQAFRMFVARLTVAAGVLGILAVLVSALVGKPVVQLLYNAEYASKSSILVWLMVAAIFSYVTSFLEVGLTTVRALRSQAMAMALSTGITAAACVLLIPRFGLLGAAYSNIAGAAARALLCAVALHRAIAVKGK